MITTHSTDIIKMTRQKYPRWGVACAMKVQLFAAVIFHKQHPVICSNNWLTFSGLTTKLNSLQS